MLPLEIETGRWVGSPDRACRVCVSGAVEDERHFLMHCKVYQECRDKVAQQIEGQGDSFISLSEQEKFAMLMSGKHGCIAPFIRKCLYLRAGKLKESDCEE